MTDIEICFLGIFIGTLLVVFSSWLRHKYDSEHTSAFVSIIGGLLIGWPWWEVLNLASERAFIGWIFGAGVIFYMVGIAYILNKSIGWKMFQKTGNI